MPNLKKNMRDNRTKIGVIGLGYVGLPIAIEFSKKFRVIGYDLKKKRIKDLNNGFDSTNEIKKFNSKKIFFSDQNIDLKECNVFIVTVPTPVDKNNNPDFRFLIGATKTIAKFLKKEDLVIYESTVHPGATEEICVPLLEKISKLECHTKDRQIGNFFYCGYSPERINPGDKNRTLKKILKLVSGASKKSTILVQNLYRKAGLRVFKTKNIKTAEAAKIIENTQRDLNIALINEFSIIFNKMNIDTYDVLEAAGTKWNFLKFKPGLVGGHCIGVDPYYLTHAAKKIGYNPKVILAGRKINNDMAREVFQRIKKKITLKKMNKKILRVIIFGFTFKENCSDIRNSKVWDLYRLFSNRRFKVDVFDPNVSMEEIKKEYGIKLKNSLNKNFYDIAIICVAHNYFIRAGLSKILSYTKKDRIIFDIKNIFNNDSRIDLRL